MEKKEEEKSLTKAESTSSFRANKINSLYANVRVIVVIYIRNNNSNRKLANRKCIKDNYEQG